ncbi:hypothetical protein NN561_013410 [Cricetulus griseus]
MCRELPVARPDCKRMSAHLRPPARSLHLAPARESGLERCFHTDSSREFMDLDCTQQGILFSDERKNIQQPVFALGGGERRAGAAGPWPRKKDPRHPGEATTRVLLLRGARAARPRSGLRCGGWAGLRGAGARVGPADSVPSRILY